MTTNEISTRDMTVHNGDLVIERSDMRGLIAYNALAVRSHKTGRVAIFRFTRELRDDEREIYAWEYRSVDLPNPVRLTIYND